MEKYSYTYKALKDARRVYMEIRADVKDPPAQIFIDFHDSRKPFCSGAHWSGDHRRVQSARWSQANRPAYDVSVSVEPETASINGQTGFVYRGEIESRIPGDSPPTFKTIDINRRYQVETHVIAQIFGKSFRESVSFQLINLTSNVNRSAVISHDQPVLNGWSISSDSPPTYEDDEEPEGPGKAGLVE